MSFSNKVIIITGGSSGIGAETAIAFSVKGAHVVIVERNEDKLKAVAAKCQEPLVIKADLNEKADVHRVIAETIKKFGQIDVLVNAAASAMGTGRLVDGKIMETYDTMMGVNFKAAVILTSLAAPYLIKTKGNIVNISSILGKKVFQPGTITYNISKACLSHFTVCAAAELGPMGVRVNAVSPGPVKTDLLKNSNIDAEWDIFNQLTLLDRVSEAQEVAGLILFLASDRAKSIVGSNFVIDNGMLWKCAI